jgi:hypothetical protein
MGVKG